MNKLSSLTICVPLYNEENIIEELSENLKKLNKDLENIANATFLLVDDGSKDSTFVNLNYYFSKLENFVIVKHNSNLNLGGFLETAISSTNTEYIVFLDSDSTFDPQLVIPMLEIIEKGYDVVNASHLHPKGNTKDVVLWRIIVSKIANLIYRIILNKKVYSFTSICKLYRVEKIKNIKLEFYGFVAVTELFIKCLLLNAKYFELPCSLTTRKKGESKLRYSKTIPSHLKLIFRILKIKLVA